MGNHISTPSAYSNSGGSTPTTSNGKPLIVTGERETVVTALGEGRFQPVDVVTGMQRGGEVEILSGLNEGDEVVVSGQFLIDSESSLQASFMRMSEVGKASPELGSDAPAQHAHQ